MLQTNTHGNAFCLERNALRVKIAIDILCRMSRCKNHSASKKLPFIGTYSANAVTLYKKFLHSCLKMNLPAAVAYGVTDIFYYSRQLIGS